MATAPQKAPLTAGPANEPPGSSRAGRALLFHPGERFEPCCLRQRAGRPVVEALLLLAPVAEVGEPLEPASSGRKGRDRNRVDSQFAQRFAGVVAADAGAVLTRSGRRRSSRRRSRASQRPGRRPGAFLPSRTFESSQSARSPPACWKRIISLGSSASACRALPASKAICIPSQSPSCRSLNWLKYQKNQYWTTKPGWPDLTGDVGVGDRRRFAFRLQLCEVARVDAGVAKRIAVQVEVEGVAEPGDVGGGRRPLDRLFLAAFFDPLERRPTGCRARSRRWSARTARPRFHRAGPALRAAS